MINVNQKKPSRGVLKKRSSENMQLCNFIKITLRHECSLLNLLNIFRTPFPNNNSGGLLLVNENRSFRIVFFSVRKLKTYFWNKENCPPTEAATRRVLSKKVFVEISQNSQENSCARASFFLGWNYPDTILIGHTIFDYVIFW